MTEEKKSNLSEAEEEELFKFDDKTLDNYEDDALIDKGEYVLEVEGFKRIVKVVTEENQKEGEELGETILGASWKIRHKRDKNGKIDPSLMGRRYDLFVWRLGSEGGRDQAGGYYRIFGFGGAYVPQYKESEFIKNKGQKNESRSSGLFYIGKYNDSQTKRDKNSRPKPVNDTKTKKQEKKDAKGPVEL